MVTVSDLRTGPRRTSSTTPDPGARRYRLTLNCLAFSMGLPSTATITSSGASPPRAALDSGATSATSTPSVRSMPSPAHSVGVSVCVTAPISPRRTVPVCRI